MPVLGVDPFATRMRTTSVQCCTPILRPLGIAPGLMIWHSVSAFTEVVSLPFWSISPCQRSDVVVILVSVSKVIPALLVPPRPNRSMHPRTASRGEPHVGTFVGENVFPSPPAVGSLLFLIPWPDDLLIPSSTVRTGYRRDWASINRVCGKLPPIHLFWIIAKRTKLVRWEAVLVSCQGAFHLNHSLAFSWSHRSSAPQSV